MLKRHLKENDVRQTGRGYLDYIYMTTVHYFIPGKSPNQTSEQQTNQRVYFLDLHHLKLSHSRREGTAGWPLWKTGDSLL